MSHIFFSIRTLLFAFVMLASSLIVRPMIGDPDVPVKVETPAASAVVDEGAEAATAFDYVLLADCADKVFVGRILHAVRSNWYGREGLPEAFTEVQVEVQIGLKGTASRERMVFFVPAETATLTLGNLISNVRQEAFFFLGHDAAGRLILEDEERGVVWVQGGKLSGDIEADGVSAKVLAKRIALGNTAP